ncbi:amidohydrolase family protein [Comamonas testosteroni]|uniref:Amidohydrolase 3 n=1 Tax=Comamonas testosteroni (strain DSM 14576 / KF-1) TaxID=399795 RepID=B7X4X0_COMTK|nr:amidohydrolase family protein [Comamonas testosteroni]EED68748.1 Amidohydrolase 3 [Comamonas testosteroni KF-1]WQG66749.1 amidohydrolase family protein [Comamonas testosteroni]
MQQFELLIRNGRIVDGTGAPIYRADLGVRNGHIAAIGQQLGDAVQQIDADGLLVTPGFVDVHTHFDGQATWDERLWPSSQQGVTTAVMGNCGVGFAPCRPEDRDQLIALMVGVEDIPDTALHEGLRWSWESFPEYLQALAARRYDIDIAALLPHAPLRVHAMGERAIRREPASAEDIKAMQQLVRQGLAAGAVGLSTSRTMAHRSKSGDFTPMYQAASEELLALGLALKDYPNSVFQMISDFEHVGDEFSILTRVAQRTGRAATLTVLQYPHRPQLHRELLQQIEKANADGLRIMGQVLNRPVGVLMGFECSLNPFSCRPSYAALAPLEPAERLRALALPATRSAILGEKDRNPHLFMEYFGQNFAGMYPWRGEEPNYLPQAGDSVQALADAAGVPPLEWMYDFMLGREGQALVYLPMANYLDHDCSAVHELLGHPHTVPALGDGGAHVGTICDGSATTFLLTEWVRERGLFSIEQAIHLLTQRPASLYGFADRGVLQPGKLADLNLIDLQALRIEPPHIARDLPAGGKRFLQGAQGYRYTIKSGQITYRDGSATEALPGRLLKRSELTPG